MQKEKYKKKKNSENIIYTEFCHINQNLSCNTQKEIDDYNDDKENYNGNDYMTFSLIND